MVRYGDLVGVTAQILNDSFRRSKRTFGVNNPFGFEGLFGNVLRYFEFLSQSSHELSSEYHAQCPFRKQIPTTVGRFALVFAVFPFIGLCNTASGYNTMNMRVKPKLLTPCVQNRYHTRFGTQIFGIGGKGLDSLPRGGKQGIIQFFVMHRQQGIKAGRQGEDNMIVWNGQQFAFPIYDPSFTISSLTFGAVSVSTRIVRDCLYTAALTNSHMSSQSEGSAQGQRPEGFSDLCYRIKLLFKCRTVKTNDIADFILRLQRA